MKAAGANLKFTVIIPTRDRCDTLRWALKTCTDQNYDDLEIIVSDNFSQDGTREVVESFNDKRIRYINTGSRISMSGNFEFALTHATGDYVTMIGDDDGMITNSIEEIDRLIRELRPSILTWEKSFYSWENHHDDNLKGVLSVPDSRNNSVRRVDATAFLNSTCSFGDAPTSLIFSNEFPSIYHSFASSETIKKARSANGTFFHSRIPDIYSGVALASATSEFWHSNGSFSIHGASSHSIGDAQFSGNEEEKSPAVQFLNEENLPFHPNMLFCYSLAVMIIESLLQVRSNVPNARHTDFDPKALITKALSEGREKRENVYDSIVLAVRHIGKVYNVETYAEQAISENAYRGLPPTEPVVFGYHPVEKRYIVKGGNLGIKNIYEAALFCEKSLKDNSFSKRLKQSLLYIYNAATKRGFSEIARKGFARINNISN